MQLSRIRLLPSTECTELFPLAPPRAAYGRPNVSTVGPAITETNWVPLT